MLRTLQPKLCLCLTAGVALTSRCGYTTGFDLPDQDAFAVARGMAVVATADNPSAIYYNPAGITQLRGHNVRGGLYGLYLSTSYESPSGNSTDNKAPWHGVPQFFYTYGPETLPVSFGLGVYSPFGLSMEWPHDTGFRTLATKGSLNYMTINPVVAWQALPSLSVGAGISANYSKVDLRQGLAWPAQGYDEFRFEGDGWDVGYSFGVLWKACEKISLGATFRSTTTVDLDGSTRFWNSTTLPLPTGGAIPAFPEQEMDASASFPFPLKMIVGISYRPTEDWNIEFNADYTDWSRLGTVTVQQAGAFPPLLPQNIPLVLNWEASWYFEWGVTRYLPNGWHLSGGYIFNQNSVPDDNYNPLVADLDRHFWSIGTGRKWERLTMDVAYQFGYGPTRTVSGSAPSGAGQSADGDFEFLSHAVMLSVGFQF